MREPESHARYADRVEDARWNVRLLAHPIGKTTPMPVHVRSCFSEAALGEIPHLRAYARMMTNDLHKADHEVEETLKRAPSIMDRMAKRSDLRAQLLIILRCFLICSERGHWRDINTSTTIYEQLSGPFRIENGYAKGSLGLASALVCLDFEDREAVVLSAGAGLSRQEAAKICGCEVGVYGTRLARGLARLAELFRDERSVPFRGDITGEAVAAVGAAGLH